MTAFPQSLKEACRWVCFETPVEGWEVATNGGTLFIVACDGIPYGLTARHNLHTYAWGHLIVTSSRKSNRLAGIRAVSYVGKATGHAEGSDLTDLAIVQFSPDVTAEFFDGSIYDLDEGDLCVSRFDDDLTIYGALSQDSRIGDKVVSATFAELGFRDNGPSFYDPAVLRSARGQWLESRVACLAGISGCPIFNTTQPGLCGMVLRGGIHPETGIATIHYLGIDDIARILHSVHEGNPTGFYHKTVAHPI